MVRIANGSETLGELHLGLSAILYAKTDSWQGEWKRSPVRPNGHKDGDSKCCGAHQSMDITLSSPGHPLQPGCL